MSLVIGLLLFNRRGWIDQPMQSCPILEYSAHANRAGPPRQAARALPLLAARTFFILDIYPLPAL